MDINPLREYFYIESLEQLDSGDYIRYLSFTDNGFELKKGGQFVNIKDNFIVLKSSAAQEKSSFWKITDKTPIFCRLNDNDKMILVLMEKTS